MNYRPRIADKLLENKLKGMGAVLVEGAKWCGKTTTGEQHAASVLYMDNPKDRTSNLLLRTQRLGILISVRNRLYVQVTHGILPILLLRWLH